MNTQEKHSNLINDARIGQILNNDMNNVRELLKTYCHMKGYKGELLNAYNKCFIFVDLSLRDYICGTLNESKVLPKKYAIEFLSQL
jgi:hypothetical protein